LNNPSLLFLDEPTAGLDPVNAKIIKDIIRDQQQQGKTIFLTTHNMYDADELCNRVAFIVEGELSIIEEPAVLKLQHGRQTVEVIAKSGEEYTQADVHCFELDQLGSNQQFIDLLNSGTVESIYTQEATLEEVFIKTTGAQLT
ncbi:MAG: ABC transporter ATP-binding protein, partial [Gammaproteobacteria bacterium]|nr:ABC transporter ATP-binding protein [Gammaproteobacteria bacterium]